ncbi:hypothetical protein [Lysinibacillus piscis]|uniref:Uncharacterized protein n=1 Tax=Lysinibacillus piscis TaxID=2518931 RepID=A0ABQ5NF26_9BACI|nr:hypothetical protein [Lysinibacillus sp. KH24]GLC86941.1 hypothetical protein LYSBPC_00680 [Lysinibacillus sp. KH24]
MNDLKKQMEQIEIPAVLHQRSVQGIQQAQKEHKRWLPKILTAVATLAACMMVALLLGEPVQTSPQTSHIMQVTSSLFYWLIWFVGLVLAMLVALKKAMDKALTISFGCIGLLLVGNSAYYWQHQLPQPIVVPLVYDFDEQNEVENFALHYVVNKSDNRVVSYLQADNRTFLAMPFHVTASDYPADVIDENAHQWLRRVHFIVTKEDIQALVNSRQLFIVLEDGQKLPVTADIAIHEKRIAFARPISVSGSSHGDRTEIFEMQEDIVFERLVIPSSLKPYVQLQDITIDNTTSYHEQDFPITVKKGQQIQLRFYIKQAPINMRTTIRLQGPNQTLWLGILQDASLEDVLKEGAGHD